MVWCLVEHQRQIYLLKLRNPKPTRAEGNIKINVPTSLTRNLQQVIKICNLNQILV
jgi:hypothetical protein